MTRNQISYQEMLIRAKEAKETERANLAREAENYRANAAKESENVRHNLASEAVERTKASAAVVNSVGSVLKGVGSVIPF